MVFLCFLIDLPRISPLLLKDLKQCLLQLANLYAISSPKGQKEFKILDRIGLCYVQRNRVSGSDEVKIAYNPVGNFNLRMFHHAINSLSNDNPCSEYIDGISKEKGADDEIIFRLLNNKDICSWGRKDVSKKAIFISTNFRGNIESMRTILMDAADKCISVEFLLLEKQPEPFENSTNDAMSLLSSISDLENCFVSRYLPDIWIFRSLVPRWLQELKGDVEEPFQAIIQFRDPMIDSMRKIFCNINASTGQVIDGFNPCQTCSCHGSCIDSDLYSESRRFRCPISGNHIGTPDTTKNAVQVGEQNILFLPSFWNYPKLSRVSSICLNVIERTSLVTLSEGLVFGSSYVVTPSASHEIEAMSDGCENSELNSQLFYEICRALHSMDQGLVCSSNCNTETMMETTFTCFYILQASERGPMLLRRLAGSEEILYVPKNFNSKEFALSEEIKNSIQDFLSKINLRDYNPLFHERGFHQKLNLLVKESLQNGCLLPQRGHNNKHRSPTPEPTQESRQPSSAKESRDDSKHSNVEAENKSIPGISDLWENLIVEEPGECFTPTCISKANIETSTSILLPEKTLDEKTTRILERLEAPKTRKLKSPSPVININNVKETKVPTKKPLVPLGVGDPCLKNQILSWNQPMKPSFQRPKRKER